MKHMLAGLALLVGANGAAFCQTNDRPVHPGTAILDSMGIVAGAPDQMPKRDAQADTAKPTMPATKVSTPATHQ